MAMVKESHKEKSSVSEVSETDRLRKRVEELESRERQREREEFSKKVEGRLADFQIQQRRQQQAEQKVTESFWWVLGISAIIVGVVFGALPLLGVLSFGYSNLTANLIWLGGLIFLAIAVFTKKK